MRNGYAITGGQGISINDFIDATRSKFGSPVFFPFLLSTLFLNWKAFYLLAFFEGTSLERIEKFECYSSPVSLILFPLLISLPLTVGTPYLRQLLGRVTGPGIKNKRIFDAKIDFKVEESRIGDEITLSNKRIEIAKLAKEVDTVISSIENEDLKKASQDAISGSGSDQKIDEQYIAGYDWLLNNSEIDLASTKEKGFFRI